MWIKQTIGEQRKVLTSLLEPPMLNLSKLCVSTWTDVNALDQLLNSQFTTVPHCHLIYVIDKMGKQISSNVRANQQIDMDFRGQDLSRRPYSVSLYPKRHFMLSSVYISNTTGRPCISAVQPIIDEQQFLGFLVADFDIAEIPVSMASSQTAPLVPKEIRTPSLTNQTTRLIQPRINSPLDQHIHEINEVLERLIKQYGIFHCTLHYSSAQVMLWHVYDPYQYRLFTIEQLFDSETIMNYPHSPYPPQAVLPQKNVRAVLDQFRTLRLADERIYLRSGSLNIMNGMVGLSFSTEGSQYLPVDVFLSKDLSFWFGQSVVNE
ncbi:PDC sensor domain-containing protein [Beggiatoa leptomitoformis]|uniref:Uncharacterized protein n=1 Tax=Beggiatoa leptomitoformis TaxID=288004 RepID=A0A2N9YG15_9GAMM|nr:PDC sensor domain-containing protein [Beggiatoa leptomitoformis]ALG68185.1 hypothetical protein AL038_11300 [Beggiatoa leptomitoformis]AUI69511.1 hypothetical protein BLE401_12970 [Beggiatoa leptomitoformis]